MSENSLENSTFSENNSFSDVQTNLQPESFSLSSPSSQQLTADDLQSSYSSSNLNLSPVQLISLQQQEQTDLASSFDLLSLPTMTSNVRTTAKQFMKSSGDAELNELLSRKQPKFMPQAPKCAKCDKSVYKAEEIRAANKTFHKLCFKCNSCNKLLEPNILTEHQGDLYCKTCYARNFGPKGYGYSSGAAGLSTEGSPQFISNNQRSSVKLFTSPELKSTFSTFESNQGVQEQQQQKTHTQQQQSRPVSSTRLSLPASSVFSNSNGYTSPVVNRSGAHINSAQNSENRRTNGVQFGGSDKCARCQKAVYAAEKVVAASKYFHKGCFTCSTCKKSLNSMNCCDNSEGEIFCKCKKKLFLNWTFSPTK